MKKILLLSDSFNGYGAEYMIGWVGSMFAENEYDVTFCSVFDTCKSDKLSPKSKFFSLRLKRNQNPILKLFFYFIFSGIKIVRYCRTNNIDFLITFKENPLCIALLANMFLRISHIHSERDDPFNRDTIASKLKMWLYRFTDHIVFQTKGAQAFFPKKIINKSTIIPNPVSVSELKWNPHNAKKTIASVGRLNIRYKRQDLLILAFAKIKDNLKDWNLVFYGDGPDRGLLEELVEKQGVSNHVIFYGKVDDVPQKLVEDGIFVLTSDTEGLPNALLEAMALGMPVISTDCSPGGARMLINNKNGILVERGNVDDLAESILLLLNNKSLAESLATGARNSVQQYDPLYIVKLWEQVIEKLNN